MPPQSRKSKKNVLPNSYIPVLSKKVLTNVLSRLPKSSLIELINLWPKLVNTQPQTNHKSDKGIQKRINEKVLKTVQQFKSSPNKWPKRKIIDIVLIEFWPNGLNLLQLSQVDCQLIVDHPNTHSWILSTIKDSKERESSILLNPQKFLDTLAKDLSALFMTNIYVCRHPLFPLIIIRIQVFDIQPMLSSGDLKRPHISSHKPYFLAVPLNSPHIIHSPGDDMVTNIVLQAVERSLPQSPRNLLKLETPKNQKPIRSLESMHILKGSSRFGKSLGIWAPYADGSADILPLNSLEKHDLFQKNVHKNQNDNEEDRNLHKLKKNANLRFKGSRDGKLISEKLFDDDRPLKKRKTNLLYNLNNSDDEGDLEINSNKKHEFSSITPIQYAEYVIKDRVHNSHINSSINQGESDEDENYCTIKLKLTGLDVFAGLHELSVLTTNEDEAVVNPSTIPGWLTGEEGQSCGEVKDGRFIPISK